MEYKQMAYVYDKFMAEAPYDKWIQFTLERLKNKKIKTIADLGCGTGEITVRLAEEGFQMIGVDFSMDMLSYAEHKASNKNVPITWLHQNLQELEGLNDLDVAISYCDVINYITEEDNLKNVFQRIYQSLKKDGVFIFDVHSIYHVEQNYKNQTFADVMEDVSYIWFCLEGETIGDMYHDLTFFALDGDKYIRFDEIHHQRTYSIDFYKKLLYEIGFHHVQVYADFRLEEENITSDSERIFFVAERCE
ncbi:class I SAM-dependent DNA methyltransferase [Oceanobacillus senegalensis]|uniref:class I SAM-dependent DNA methyltransferase n=1 Tax=Oceanobacillus senegalensis TaxID=1936063 RepID=UPI000A3132DE|nr:class I SAM-dependent methyltransferase [Oceanobacillus senegalensis]